jgi:hypothetical protein
MPNVQAGKEVARLRPGETTVLRDDKACWCLGLASEFNTPRVDFFARRLQGKAKSCSSPARG